MSLIPSKWRRGLDSSLKDTEITNGSIFLSTDTGRIHVDIDDERIEVTAPHIEVETSEETTDSQEADYGDSFNTVDSVTRDEFGHVTDINTKTVTLPGVLSGFYGECTSESTTVKAVNIDKYALITGAFITITFDTEVGSGATLNISDTGAIPIYHMSSAIGSKVITAGASAVFTYTGSRYILLCCDTEAGYSQRISRFGTGIQVNNAMYEANYDRVSDIGTFKYYDEGTPDLDAVNAVDISAEDSEVPIYIWAVLDTDKSNVSSDAEALVIEPHNDDDSMIIYWWTGSNNVELNENMQEMFEDCSDLVNIEELYDWDVSKVINMLKMFSGCKKLDDFTGLNNWNVDQEVVKDSEMFKDSGAYNNYESNGDSSGYPDWYKTDVEFKEDDD